MNSESSRSHAILTLYVDSEPAEGAGGGGLRTPAQGSATTRKRYGKISLLELVSLEYLRSSGLAGAGVREAGAINRSLFVLGQCIKALSHDQGQPPPRPRRARRSRRGSTRRSVTRC